MIKNIFYIHLLMILFSVPALAQGESDKPIVQSLSGQDYDALLQENHFIELKQNLGPVLIELDTAWLPNGNSVWTKVKIAKIPNLPLMVEPAVLIIEGIYDKSGKQIGKENILNEKMPLIISQNFGNSVHFYESPKTIDLQDTYKVSDVAAAKGKVILNLPVDIKQIDLSKDDVNQEQKLGNHTIKLLEMKENKVRYQHSGVNGEAFKIKAYDREGKPAEFEMLWRSDMNGIVTEEVTYKAPPEKVHFTIADKIVTREYPFNLK